MSSIFQNTEEEIIFEPEVSQNNNTNKIYQEDEIDEDEIQSLVEEENRQDQANMNNEIDEDEQEKLNLEEEQNEMTTV